MAVCDHLPKIVYTFAHPKFVRDHMACESCAAKKTHANFQHRQYAGDRDLPKKQQRSPIPMESLIVADEATIRRLRQIVADRQEQFDADDRKRVDFDTTPASKESFEFLVFERKGKTLKSRKYKNFNFGVVCEDIVTPGGPKMFKWRLYHFGGAF